MLDEKGKRANPADWKMKVERFPQAAPEPDFLPDELMEIEGAEILIGMSAGLLEKEEKHLPPRATPSKDRYIFHIELENFEQPIWRRLSIGAIPRLQWEMAFPVSSLRLSREEPWFRNHVCNGKWFFRWVRRGCRDF